MKVKESCQNHQQETPHYKTIKILVGGFTRRFPFFYKMLMAANLCFPISVVALGVTRQGADWDGSEGGAVLGGAVFTVHVPQGFDVS